jgi:hypothetical protein
MIENDSLSIASIALASNSEMRGVTKSCASRIATSSRAASGGGRPNNSVTCSPPSRTACA